MAGVPTEAPSFRGPQVPVTGNPSQEQQWVKVALRLALKKSYLPPYGKTGCEPISCKPVGSRGTRAGAAPTEVRVQGDL